MQILGMSYAVIGHVSDPGEPATKDGGCLDGDTLANLGFTNIQVGGTAQNTPRIQDQGVAFAKGGWKTQGIGGNNQLIRRPDKV